MVHQNSFVTLGDCLYSFHLLTLKRDGHCNENLDLGLHFNYRKLGGFF